MKWMIFDKAPLDSDFMQIVLSFSGMLLYPILSLYILIYNNKDSMSSRRSRFKNNSPMMWHCDFQSML